MIRATAPSLNMPQPPGQLPWILLIDDHALFRAGMQLILGDGPEPLGRTLEAGSLAQALTMAQTPSLVLLDVELPGLNGLDGLKLIKRRWPDAAVVMLSAHESPSNTSRALKRGAMAFVNKNASPAHIRRVALQALRGVPEQVSEQARSEPMAGKAAAQDASVLSTRQLEVLALLCEGLSNKVIAHRLNLSENTVRNHLVAVMRHFDATTRTEVITAAQRLGVVHQVNVGASA